MSDINLCTFTGRLTRDPELETGKSGKEYTNFNIANETGWGDSKKTNFIRLTAFDKAAVAICKYFGKGDQIIVTCEYSVDEYEKDGQKQHSHKHIVRGWTFGAKAKGSTNGADANTSPVEGFSELNEEDVPF